MFDSDRVKTLISRLPGGITSSLVVNAFYIMSSQGLMAVLGFVFWVIVARFYTEAEVGYSAAIISALGLLSMIGCIGLDSFLVRFLSRSENPKTLVNTCLLYGSIATLAVALVFVAGIEIWSPRIAFVKSQPVFLAAFVCFAVANTQSSLCDSSFVAGRRSRFLLTRGGIFGLAKLFLPLLFVQYFHAFGIVASWGVATVVALAISVFIFLPRVVSGYRVRLEMGARIVRRAWGFSGLSYMTTLIGSMPKFLMPLIVINVLGAEANGFFYIAWAISTMLFSIPGSIAQSLFAEGSHDRRTLRRDFQRAMKTGFTLLLPAILFLILLGDRVLLTFGYGYAERSMDLLRILAVASIPLTLERIYFAVLRVRGRLRELLVWNVAVTGALLLGSYYAISNAGITSIGWVYLAAHSLIAILVVVFRKSDWRGASTN